MAGTSREFMSVFFDQMTMDDLVSAVIDRLGVTSFGYVTTPNVDHMIRIHSSQGVAALYREAWLCINDSRILELLASLVGVRLPALPGADLVARLLCDDRLDRTTPILVVGGPEGLDCALASLLGLTAVTQYRPPMGLMHDEAAFEATLQVVEGSRAWLVLLAVGSPQQEHLAAALRARGRAHGIALCIGAGLEFLVGARKRAPRWMRWARLEWAFRLLSEPRRLAWRYLVIGPRIFRIFLTDQIERHTRSIGNA